MAKAAAGLPHLSRKKGECASLSTVFANCDLRFFGFFRERCFGLRSLRIHDGVLVYIYICEDMYIYFGFIFMTFATGCVSTCR